RPVVEELGAIADHDGTGTGALNCLWRNFDFFSCCRREANRQRKSVHDRARDDSPSGCDFREADQIPGHRVSPWLRGYRDGLTNRARDCPSAIAVVAERLLPLHLPPPIARGFAGELLERCGERGLRGV